MKNYRSKAAAKGFRRVKNIVNAWVEIQWELWRKKDDLNTGFRMRTDVMWRFCNQKLYQLLSGSQKFKYKKGFFKRFF